MLSYLPSPLDLFAIIFGILLTLRKLDVAHRQPAQHPNVASNDFALWQASGMRAYGFGVWACFLKIALGFTFRYWAFGLLQPSLLVGRIIGISLEIAWIAAMVATWLKIRRVHRLAEQVGVETPRGGVTAGS